METGCPVVCNRNSYSKNIFNGNLLKFVEKREKSTICEYELKNGKTVLVEFVGSEQLYIDPAHAITIHKSQGSTIEYPIVFYGSHARSGEKVNNKNSLYTAMTRAKRDVEVFFEDEGTREMCATVSL